MKTLIGAVLVAVLATTAGASEQLRRSVARELPHYGIEVSVSELSTAQLAAMHHILNSNHSHSEKRSLLRSAAGSRYSLRGLLFGR